MAPSLDDPALTALDHIAFNYTLGLKNIWSDTSEHVAEVNGDVARRLLQRFERETLPGAESPPLGWAVVGRAGAGKTHLLSTLRREVWASGGWFVLLDLLDVNDFWSTTALGFVDSLSRPMPGGTSQGVAVFDRLRERFGLPQAMTTALGDIGLPSWSTLTHQFAAAVRRADTPNAMKHRDVVFAFMGMLSGNPELQDLGRHWLTGANLEATDRLTLPVLRSAIPPRKAVEGLSWLMSLGGPTLCALDQIDAIVSVAHATAGGGASDDPVQGRARAIIDELAGGLMDLRDVTQRSVTVVTTLQATWATLCSRAIASFQARFQVVGLQQINSAEAARRLVEKRLATAYGKAAFVPPYPTWPFRPEAFAGVTLFSPRQLLQACQSHVAACVERGAAEELAAFPDATQGPIPAPPDPPPLEGRLTSPRPDDPIGRRYQELCAVPPPPGLLDLGGDDARVVDLLITALHALVRQTEVPDTQDFLVENTTFGLHARLRRIDNEAGGQEQHHCFRVIPHTNAIAAQSRLREAITASGIDHDLPFRRLIILRRGFWPSGPKMAALARQFELHGGRTMAPDAADFARFAALRTLLAEAPPGLDAWLRGRRPLADSPFFRDLGLVDTPSPSGASPPVTPPSPVVPPSAPVTPPALAAPSAGSAPEAIPLGVRVGDRQTVSLNLALLPRHVAIVAGAGSGKTVLLRRLVEEAALAGVPSILLDSNNDLVRMADAWPVRPPSFTDDDIAKAARFAGLAEVVVWTPGRAKGNPLVLAPLPDFAAVGDDSEERDQAIGMATATLTRLVPAGGQRGQLRFGVLSAALKHFAKLGGDRLPELIGLLNDLPPGISNINNAPKLAAEVADALTAAVERNPLLDGAGTALDPAVLLGGRQGRVRVSVVNLAGLPDDEARQDFVGRLLMALFGHIRRHPAAAGQAVSGLLVMDEAQNFAPSGRASASGEATLALVRQARKYGLGMIFATQAPKAIDHNIIANCTTQVFGLTNSPAALDAVRDLLRSRGGGGEDLGRLPKGQFYVTTEGVAHPQKIVAPLCLTYHDTPPSEAEVIERAALTRGRA